MHRFVYDAWNRLVGVDYLVPQSGGGIDQAIPRTRYLYYAGHERALRFADEVQVDGVHAPTTAQRFYYDAGWRLLEYRTDTDFAATRDGAGQDETVWPAAMQQAGAGGHDWSTDLLTLPFAWRATTQHVWDPIGVDRLVQRRVATTDDPLVELPDDFDELYWAVTERGGDVVEEVPEHGGVFFLEQRERFRYSAYGVPSRTPLGDFNGDDLINSEDLTLFASVMTLDHTSPAYLHTADYDLDGTISAKGDYAAHAAELGTSGFKGDYSTSGLIVGYAGSIWDPAVELWLMRHRWLDPHSGRWLTRDPAGYVDGMSLYGYVGQGVWARFDPMGLMWSPWRWLWTGDGHASDEIMDAAMGGASEVFTDSYWSDRQEEVRNWANGTADNPGGVLRQAAGIIAEDALGAVGATADTLVEAETLAAAAGITSSSEAERRAAIESSGVIQLAEFVRDDPVGFANALKNAITDFANAVASGDEEAIGKALRAIGYGTIFAAARAASLASKAKKCRVPDEGAAATPRMTGARSGVNIDPADKAYDAIRSTVDDIADIARATGISDRNIARVKQHIFRSFHLLDRYVDQGVPARWSRFDSDERIAAAWDRLRRGAHTDDDLRFLRHEAAEAWYERRHGPGYNRAHEGANERYPSPIE